MKLPGSIKGWVMFGLTAALSVVAANAILNRLPEPAKGFVKMVEGEG